jgi:glucose-1-phosphate adenylyltransferase
LGSGAVVKDGATVRGSVIGAGGIVETGATVSDSVLLPGARVCEGAEVLSSIVGEHAVIGRQSRVSDLSIIGHQMTLGDHEKVVAGRIGEPGR